MVSNRKKSWAVWKICCSGVMTVLLGKGCQDSDCRLLDLLWLQRFLALCVPPPLAQPADLVFAYPTTTPS